MKFQPKRFVVEVKRGTSRASFTSADTVADKFSGAEEILFGTNVRKASTDPAAVAAGPAAGRVLRSLIEPPEPAVPDLPEPARRGRKPGSKNKPKVTADAPVVAARSARPAASGIGTASDDAARRDDVETAPQTDVGHRPQVPLKRSEAPGTRAASLGRIRLRHRSRILKRYVLDIEPHPGQAGSIRARKAARAAR